MLILRTTLAMRIDLCNHAFMKIEDVRNSLKKTMNGQSLREFGIAAGLSAAYLSDVLRGNREPGPRILEMLKLEKITSVSYRRREK